MFKGKRRRHPKINNAIFLEPRMKDSLFADAALPAFFRAVPTILAVLAGVARIGTSAGRRKDIDLIDEKNGQHNLSQDRK
jgi:hypothetical protein